MELELTGWVANEPDGSVHCVAEGPRAALEACSSVLEPVRPARSSSASDATGGPRRAVSRSFEIRSGGHRGD